MSLHLVRRIGLCLAAVCATIQPLHAAAPDAIQPVELTAHPSAPGLVGEDGRLAVFVTVDGIPAARAYANELERAGFSGGRKRLTPELRRRAADASRRQVLENMT